MAVDVEGDRDRGVPEALLNDLRMNAGLESPRGSDAWRAIKSGAFGFSIGFLIQDSKPRGKGKGRILTQLDLFEISLTATPVLFETRVLTTKAIDEGTDPDLDSMSLDELRDYSLSMIDGIGTKSHRPITIVSFEA